MLRWIAVLALAALPAIGQAANSAPEIRAAEEAVREQGTGTPGSERALDKARSPRTSPKQDRVIIDETLRDARQRPKAPSNGGYRSPTLDPGWRHQND